MSLKLYLFLVTCVVVVGCASADIFGDFFKWDIMSAFSDAEDDDDDENLQREEDDSSLPNSCTCQGMKCDCCVDFNISNVIDLGGPGCVNMKYISKEEGIMLNVSYGENVLHSQKVTEENKKGTCMPLLSYLAEICTRFSDLKEEDDGMVGCLNFEPTVLGEVTARYSVGCFRMGPEGMFVDNSLGHVPENEKDAETEEEQEESETEKPEEEQSFIEAVNQSAQEGLEFISNLLGFDIKNKKNEKIAATTEVKAEKISNEESNRKNKNKKIDSKKKQI